MPGGERVVRSERGQSTAMVMAMLFVLTMFLAVVANVGQAVNRRIALQVIADTGAFTGATVQAVGLNQMAYWNRAMQLAWSAFSWPMALAFSPVRVTECRTSNVAERLYRLVRTTLGVAYTASELMYPVYARLEAQRASDYNLIDLFPGEGNFRYREVDYAALILPRRGFRTEQVPQGTSTRAVWSLHSARRNWPYHCVTFPPPEYHYRPGNYQVWYRKVDDGPKYFVWVVTAPRAKAVMFDKLFGGDAIPEMQAAAAARAVGGSIEEGRRTYVAKMVPLSEVMPSVRGVTGFYDSLLRQWRTVTH